MSNRPTPGSTKARARAKTEQMRSERAAAARRARRTRRILTSVGVAVIVGLLVAIVLAVVNAADGDGGSRNSSADQMVVVPASVVDGAIPVGDASAPVTVDLYYDYMCPACGAFEQVNAPDLTELVEAGTVKVNLRVMNFLDAQSNGTGYSTRAGNAIATVADAAPEAVWDFHNALYANQPAEGTSGLSDDQIAQLAVEAGVTSDLTDTFTAGTHRGWVAASNVAAAEAGVNSTPTVKINGETFEGNWAEPGTLASAIETVANSVP